MHAAAWQLAAGSWQLGGGGMLFGMSCLHSASALLLHHHLPGDALLPSCYSHLQAAIYQNFMGAALSRLHRRQMRNIYMLQVGMPAPSRYLQGGAEECWVGL